MAQQKSSISKTQLYTIFVLIFLIIAIPFTVASLRLFLNVGVGADPQKESKEVVISNISASGGTISWTTGTDTEGLVQYGTSEDSLDLAANDIRDVGNDIVLTYDQHIVEIKNLSPSTTYYYKILNDGESSGDKATGSFKTYAVGESVSLPATRKGSINEEISYALVYVFASTGSKDSEIRSTYTSENGTFTYDVSDLKTSDGDSAFSLEGAKLVTYINALDDGKVRKVHNTDADAGALTLDPASTLEFTTDVDITEPEPEPKPKPEPEPEPEPEPVEETAGIDLMSTIYKNPDASTDPSVPTNIFVSNVNDTSFQVNWITMEPTRGYVAYGKTSSSLTHNVLDVRDSSLEVERFTHSIIIADGSLTGGDAIYFKISSNSKFYGKTGGNTAYKFNVPEVLSSPPSPNAVNGKLDYLSSSRLSSTYRDFIVYGKVKNASGTLSTYISTVPAYNSNGWTLSVGQARELDLTGTVEFSSIDLFVLGEYNSTGQETNNDTDTVTEISISPGLSLDDLKHNEEVANLSALAGTATPNTTVNISIDDTSFATSADSSGEWVVGIENLAQGTHKLNLNNSTQVLGLSFGVNLDVLPVTAFDLDKGEMLTILGFSLILMGFFIVYYIRRIKLT